MWIVLEVQSCGHLGSRAGGCDGSREESGRAGAQYQPGIVAETKPDKSPVTQADRECERMIARILSEAFPDDGILGEEGARAESRSGRRWIIDPIDGTRDYVRGNPLWANLIALEADGDVVVGVVNLAGAREALHGQPRRRGVFAMARAFTRLRENIGR